MIQSIILALIIFTVTMSFSAKNSVEGTSLYAGICDKEITCRYRGVAILMIMTQHCAGHLGTNIFTPMGGGEEWLSFCSFQDSD